MLLEIKLSVCICRIKVEHRHASFEVFIDDEISKGVSESVGEIIIS